MHNLRLELVEDCPERAAELPVEFARINVSAQFDDFSIKFAGSSAENAVMEQVSVAIYGLHNIKSAHFSTTSRHTSEYV
jgi:hypothetical protein